MNDIITVMKFTMKDMLKRKSFIVSTIIILIMIIIGFNIPNIIKTFSDNEEKDIILISDINNVFENKLDLLNTQNLNYQIKTTNDNLNTIKEKLKNDEIELGIIISKENNNIKLTYVVENAFFFENDQLLDENLTSLYKSIQIDKLNITEEEKININPTFEYDIEQADDEAKGNIMVMMIISILLFYAIYFSAYQVSSSITTEKTSKIIETLVTSTSPKNIVLGKTIGIGIVGLMQLLLIIITAYLSAKLFVEPLLIEQILDVSSLTLSLGLITLLYFILGYFTYALLYALTGSTVSKPEDIQSANSPVAMISLIGFYLAYFTMMNPTSNLNKLASILPISSPFCMPLRIMMGLSTPKDISISIIILIITIILISKITIKIYSNAILNYGTKLNIKDILKMYKQK